MKKMYMLCNAHLDPVWLWRKEEGMAEALSTFRVAADFCEKYEGFVFNHNESVLYEWVEEYELELFERIKSLIQRKRQRSKWIIQNCCSAVIEMRKMEIRKSGYIIPLISHNAVQ